jgi:hypothetical protein
MNTTINGKIVMPDPRPVMATRSPARYTGPSDEVRKAVLEAAGRACVRCHRPVGRRRYGLWRLRPLQPGVQDEPGDFIILCGTTLTGCRRQVARGIACPGKTASA